jgi:hypothetical protein
MYKSVSSSHISFLLQTSKKTQNIYKIQSALFLYAWQPQLLKWCAGNVQDISEVI